MFAAVYGSPAATATPAVPTTPAVPAKDLDMHYFSLVALFVCEEHRQSVMLLAGVWLLFWMVLLWEKVGSNVEVGGGVG